MLLPIETQRLIIRPFVMSDAPALFELDKDEKVMQYVGMKPLLEVKHTEEVIQSILFQYQQNGVGRMAVIEKESNRLIGWTGLKLNREEVNQHRDFYELGYRFLPEFWGKGYATESALPFINIAFAEYKAQDLYAYARIENTASLNVLIKLGFEKKNEFVEPDGTCVWLQYKK